MAIDTTAAEESLTDLMDDSVELLDVNVSMSKPVYTVTVRGHGVQPDVLTACRKFGFTHIVDVACSTWTPEVGDCTTITFFW